MRLLLVLCVVAAAQSKVLKHPFPRGYHVEVGIPLAKRVLEYETAIVNGFGNSRIFGGSPAPLGSHPYLAGVLTDVIDGGTSMSSASLLTNTRALFAAHCWNNGQTFGRSLTLVLGTEFFFFGGERIVTDRVILHPEWNHETIENDVAIIEMDFVGYTTLIQPIALPVGDLINNDFAGVIAQVAGFGMIEAGLTANHVHHHATVPVITNLECRAVFPFNVFESTICTSGAGGISICSGDSGGPLTTFVNYQRVQIGITSFTSGCGTGWPSAYARVTAYVPWIQQQL